MDRTETIKILAVLKAEYPRTYADKDASELEAIINLWMTAFADDDYQTVSAAVMAYIVTDNKTRTSRYWHDKRFHTQDINI